MNWEYALVGLFTGVLVGITGMGGGSLMTPILVFLFGIPPATAIGTDIAHGAAFKTVGAVQHRRMGNVRARLAGWMLIGSAPMSLLGVWVSVQITQRYGDDVESVMGQVLEAPCSSAPSDLWRRALCVRARSASRVGGRADATRSRRSSSACSAASSWV